MILLDCCCAWPLWVNLIWGIVVFIITIGCVVVKCYEAYTKYLLDEADKAREHEHDLKEMNHKYENVMFDKNEQRKKDDLKLRIEEFEKLTIQSKLLDKVIEKELAQDLEDLKSTVDKLKEDLGKAKVEISGYVLKKENE